MILEVLLNAGVQFHKVKNSCLAIAVKNEDLPMINTLIERGGPKDAAGKSLVVLNSEKDHALLVDAVNAKRIDILEILLNAGANMYLPDKEGNTPLMQAVRLGDIAVIKFLLSKNTDANYLNVKNAVGENALALARQEAYDNKRQIIIDLLKAHGASSCVIS